MISHKFDFDKFKFIKAIKREFKVMCSKKEAGLHKPFFRIIRRLSQGEYSKFAEQDLKNKWRNMKGIAVTHQKRGILTKLDRAVLELINYKNERSTYEDYTISSSEDSDNKGQFSSSDSDCDNKKKP